MAKHGYTLIDRDGFFRKVEAFQDIDWQRIIDRNATELYNRTQSETPVSTERTRPGGPHGELRRSAFVRFGQMNATVGYTKEYAPHVEFGHRVVTRGKTVGYVPGQRYLEGMVTAQRRTFQKDVKEALKNAK